MIQGRLQCGKKSAGGGACAVFFIRRLSSGHPFNPKIWRSILYHRRRSGDGKGSGGPGGGCGSSPRCEDESGALKPTNDTGSQVIVNGVPRGPWGAVAYFKYKKALIPEIMAAFESLSAENDIIVIEGREARRRSTSARMILSTWVWPDWRRSGCCWRETSTAAAYLPLSTPDGEALEPEERARIKGLLINKFRGDVEILRPDWSH